MSRTTHLAMGEQAGQHVDPLIVALQDAVRHGFDVRVTCSEREYSVRVARRYIIAGEATERIEPYAVRRPDLTDALGNALAIVGVEIGLDRAAKAKRLEEG